MQRTKDVARSEAEPASIAWHQAARVIPPLQPPALGAVTALAAGDDGRFYSAHAGGHIVSWEFRNMAWNGRVEYRHYDGDIKYMCIMRSRNQEISRLAISDGSETVWFLRGYTVQTFVYQLMSSTNFERMGGPVVGLCKTRQNNSSIIVVSSKVKEFTLLDDGILASAEAPEIKLDNGIAQIASLPDNGGVCTIAIAYEDSRIAVWERSLTAKHAPGAWKSTEVIRLGPGSRLVSLCMTRGRGQAPCIVVAVAKLADIILFFERSIEGAWASAHSAVFHSNVALVGFHDIYSEFMSIVVAQEENGTMLAFEPRDAKWVQTASLVVSGAAAAAGGVVPPTIALTTPPSRDEYDAYASSSKRRIEARIITAFGGEPEIIYGTLAGNTARGSYEKQLMERNRHRDASSAVLGATKLSCEACGGEALFREDGGLGRALCSRECQH